MGINTNENFKKTYEFFVESKILDDDYFHWFAYHFNTFHPLAVDIVNTLVELEARIPGISKLMVKRFSEIGGRDRYEPHYEQLIQLMCELIVARRLSEKFPENSGFKIEWEPTEGGDKNPEFAIVGERWRLLVEVKCPGLIKHLNKPREGVQLAARLGSVDFFDKLSGENPALRPLDNRVKDFMISANEKFATFSREKVKTYTVLVLAWSHAMFEAVSALANEASGLLTPQSFFRKNDGSIEKFRDVDGVVVTSHFSSLVAFTRDEPVANAFKAPLDYGSYGYGSDIPNPSLILNPNGKEKLPNEVIEAFEAIPCNESLDPNARPLDLVLWVPMRR